MSSTSKATSLYSSHDKIQILQNQQGQLSSLVMRRGQGSLPTGISLGGSAVNISDKIKRLAIDGDQMIGPLGFNDSTATIQTYHSTPNSIDISNGGPNFTPAVTVYRSGFATGQLDYIYGAQYPIQLLLLRGIYPANTIIITNAGNIITLTGTNVNLVGQDMFIFIWDNIVLKWRQLTNGTNAASAGANTSLSNLASTSINSSLLPANPGLQGIGTHAKYWGVISTSEVDLIDTTDPTNKFLTMSFNTSTNYCELNLLNNLLAIGQVFLYNGIPIFSSMEDDNTFGDIAYVDFYQKNEYTNANAGAASALPTNPLGYLIVKLTTNFHGTRNVKIPYYAI